MRKGWRMDLVVQKGQHVLSKALGQEERLKAALCGSQRVGPAGEETGKVNHAACLYHSGIL